MRTLDDYQRLKQVNAARRKSQSQYVRSTLMGNAGSVPTGRTPSAILRKRSRTAVCTCWTSRRTACRQPGQLELAQFLSDSARFYGCQLVISTHSPFLLALEGARIYDLDQTPAQLRRWTQLDNVRTYHDFFRAHEQEFKA